MDDITLLSGDREAAGEILDRLDEIICWARMTFQAKKSRCEAFIKGIKKEVKFHVGDEEIQTVSGQQVKS